ncbi:hypothetical protein ACVIKP_005470 [Rhizobium leguminosarum]
MTFPKEHRAKLHSTNPIERLNGEIKRRTEVVGIPYKLLSLLLIFPSVVLGVVEVQGFFWGLFVIQAADGTICADGRPMGENGTTLPRQAV